MFRFLLKFAIAALIANAAWRVGSAYLTSYRFKDEVRNAATFRKGDDAELRRKIESLAHDLDVPLEDDDLRITTDQNQGTDHSVIELSYVQSIQLFPGYERLWPFSFTVDTVYSKRF
jgi:hypothetical protein